MIKELSAISRTNQLQILENSEKVAEKLFQYLWQSDKGIECFTLKYPPTEDEKFENNNSENKDSKADVYRKRHKFIKKQIQERLAAYGEKPKYTDIQYFLSYSDKKIYIFFLSPNKKDSRWKKLFQDNRERIFNLVFKFYLLAQVLPVETINGFEELFLLHSKKLTKSKKALLVWGQNLLIRYNHHDVLTLNLTRKSRRFLPKDNYNIADGDDLGELLIHKKKHYYFDRDSDARRSNPINFMVFPKDQKDYDKFKQTQLYHYQNIMTKLEDFLRECNIEFNILNFQADHYLENLFIKNIESVECLEIINNTGIDLTKSNQELLTNVLNHHGISAITFYNYGKTISTYKKIENESEDDLGWKITEVIPWSNIQLDKTKNYLILTNF